MDNIQERKLYEALRFYRDMGFFGADYDLTDQQLIEKISIKIKLNSLYIDKSMYGLPIYFDDFILLSHDKDRVWLKDVEADVCAGNDIYVKTLNEWALISNGKFNPIDIIENWDGNKIKIEFKLAEEKKIIYPKFLNDFIDVDIVNDINSFIKCSGFQFELSSIGQLVFNCLLSKEEKGKLVGERKMEFYEGGIKLTSANKKYPSSLV